MGKSFLKARREKVIGDGLIAHPPNHQSLSLPRPNLCAFASLRAIFLLPVFPECEGR
jgi:hypothetical protein